MVYIIYGYAVQQQKVLIGVASAYIESCGCLGAGLNAGQQLEGLEYIGLTEHGRNGFDLLNGYVHCAHL